MTKIRVHKPISEIGKLRMTDFIPKYPSKKVWVNYEIVRPMKTLISLETAKKIYNFLQD
jgi:hypothetical protein